LYAQAPTIVQFTTPATPIVLVPISATAAVNVASVLTIPAPPAGLYNYVCYLAYQVGNNNTGTVVTNVVSTSTNFNAFAVKFSMIATNSADSGVMVLFNLNPTQGCVKSAAPSTATTFTSPAAGVAVAAWTWYATYFVAL
jgi:hypothetical protein